METLSHSFDAEETTRCMIHRLMELDRAIGLVFSKVEDRIKCQRERIEKVDTRIRNAELKVDKVAGLSAKATTIVATAKYPQQGTKLESTICEPGYMDEFRQVDSVYVAERQSDLPPRVSGLSEGDRDNIVSVQEQYDVCDKWMEKVDTSNTRLGSGLGSLPNNIQTIGDAILFNQDSNPYNQYCEFSDNLNEHDDYEDTKSSDAPSGSEVIKIGDAPASLLAWETSPEIGEYDVSFKPKMKNMAQFNLPSNLDLPDIADLSYTEGGGLDRSIAPSVRENGLPDLPTILDFSEPVPAFVDISSPPTIENNSSSKVEPVRSDHKEAQPKKQELGPQKSLPPPPPRSEPPPQSELRRKETTVQESPTPKLASAAVSGTGKTAPRVASAAVSGTNKPEPVAKGGMGDLLAAIRDKDSLARLKSSAEAKRRHDAIKEKEQANTENVDESKPLSLAEEMRIKLTRRQKVLSGQKDKEEQVADRARVTSMRSSVQAIRAAGKLLKKATVIQREDRTTSGRDSMMSLEGIAGLDDILASKEGSDDASVASDEEDDEWLD
uniref:WASH1 WAHD domain-containing protein n=1 Tax=Mucochytrium quahogii TaxID=96639 RepID=A0A7S2S427_9STRA|mmetsp:Transcript_37341/g.60733  ORF Transcript_37341/g.60733 Transcript_37341/m.60733 type:complete len:552 (+) Transcript_37341:268-1923(+)